MSQPWGPEVQRRYMEILLDEDQDAFIFKLRDDPSGEGYFALPRQTPLAMQMVMNASDIIAFCSVRMKHLPGASI